MGTYLVWSGTTAGVAATSNSTAGTEDVFIQLTGASGKRYWIRRMRVFYRGDTTAVGDNTVQCRLITVTTASGGSGTSVTPQPIDPEMPAAVTSCIVKNGTTALALGTGTVTQYLSFDFNERGFYEWAALDPSERITAGSAGIAELVILSSAASRQYWAEIEFDE
jgi:hypothetical protein